MGTRASLLAIAAACVVAAAAAPGCAGPQRGAPTETQPGDTRTPAAAPEPERVHAAALSPAPPTSPETPPSAPPDSTPRAAPMPRVEVTRLDIKGSHDPRFMRILFDNQNAKLGACLLHAQHVDPQLGGGVMTWQLGMDRWGRIGKFDLIARSLLSPTFEACARTILSTLRGPEAGAASTVVVTYSLEPATR